MWINNITPKEAEMAIAAGAMGCTQNPSYTWKILNHPEEKEKAKKVLLETMAEYGYVSIQGDPIHEEDPDVIIKEVENLRY